MSPALKLILPRAQYLPGEQITGTVTVVEGGDSRSLEVFLNCQDNTSDYSGTSFSEGTGHLHEGDLETGQGFEFTLQVPADAVPSFRTPHGVVYWEVDAKSDEFGRDTHDKRQIDIRADAAQVTAGPVPAGAVATVGEAGSTPPEAVPEVAPPADARPGSYPPGWYPDPWLEGRIRHWDGNAWTDQLSQ